MCFWCQIQEIFTNPKSQTFPPVYSLRLSFSSYIHIYDNWFKVWGGFFGEEVFFCVFVCFCKCMEVYLLKRLSPHWITLAHLLEINWPYIGRVYFWTILHCWSLCLPVCPYHTVLSTLTLCWLLKSSCLSQLCFSFLKSFWLFYVVCIYTYILGSVYWYSLKKASWDFTRGYFEFLDQFEKNWHLNHARFCNPCT